MVHATFVSLELSDVVGDNKNKYLLFLAAWLVVTKQVDEVEIAMLMVGHTHEDIDQFFSIPSKFFRGLPDQLVRDIREFFEYCKKSMKSGQHLKMDYLHACFDYKGWSIENPVNNCYNSSIEGIATRSTAGYEAWEKPKIFRFKWRDGEAVCVCLDFEVGLCLMVHILIA